MLYGLLAWFSARASLAGGNSKPNAVGFALAVVLVIAAFDEVRQSTHPQRVGSPMDVLIDLSGAAVFLFFTKATKGVRSK
jgi:VanZ family protein